MTIDSVAYCLLFCGLPLNPAHDCFRGQDWSNNTVGVLSSRFPPRRASLVANCWMEKLQKSSSCWTNKSKRDTWLTVWSWWLGGLGSCDQFVYGLWGEYSGYYSPICLQQLTTVDIGKASPVETRLTQFLVLLKLARVTFTLRFNNTHRVKVLLQTIAFNIVCVQ